MTTTDDMVGIDVFGRYNDNNTEDGQIEEERRW